MIGKRLSAIAVTAGLVGGMAWMAVPAASAAPMTCLHGQQGTFADSGSPIYTTSSLTVVVGTANAGDTFSIGQIDPGSPAKYLGSDTSKGISGWVSSTELTNIHCLLGPPPIG